VRLAGAFRVSRVPCGRRASRNRRHDCLSRSFRGLQASVARCCHCGSRLRVVDMAERGVAGGHDVVWSLARPVRRTFLRMRVYPDGPRTSRVASPVSEQPDKAVSDLSLCELFSVEVRTMYCVVLATHPNPVLDEIPGQLGVGPVLVHRQLFFNSLSRFIVTAVSQYRIDPSTAGGGWQTVTAIAISRNAGLCPRSLAFTHARTSLIPGDTNRQVVQSMNVTAGSTASSRC
jgi:hypothetical protein